MNLLKAIDRRIGLALEVLFWRRWVATRGLASAIPIEQLLDPDRPFPAVFRPYIDDLPDTTIRVLDVGAGPITHVGRRHPTKTIVVTPTDLLADRYRDLLARAGITPPVATVYADAEALSATFPAATFHLAIGNNSIDHCSDPLKAIAEMLAVTRPGGHVVLRHRENEAQRAKYLGLHKWNFAVEHGAPLLWNPDRRIDLAQHFAATATVALPPEPGHVVIVFQRR